MKKKTRHMALDESITDPSTERVIMGSLGVLAVGGLACLVLVLSGVFDRRESNGVVHINVLNPDYTASNATPISVSPNVLWTQPSS